jgi:hypothetical protein
MTHMPIRSVSLVIAVVLATAVTAGCGSPIQAKYRPAYDLVEAKVSDCKDFKVGTAGFKATLFYEPEVRLSYAALDTEIWRDVTFHGLTPRLIGRIFEVLEIVAEEEKYAYGENWVGRQHAAAILPFTRGLTDVPSFRNLVMCFGVEGSPAGRADRLKKVRRIVDMAITAVRDKQAEIDSGYYNSVFIKIGACEFTLTPSFEAGRLVAVHVFDPVAGPGLSGNNHCYLTFNDRGDVVSTRPERHLAPPKPADTVEISEEDDP